MAELSSQAVPIAVLIAGALLYALIWYASRGLSRLAKILAREPALILLLKPQKRVLFHPWLLHVFFPRFSNTSLAIS